MTRVTTGDPAVKIVTWMNARALVRYVACTCTQLSGGKKVRTQEEYIGRLWAQFKWMSKAKGISKKQQGGSSQLRTHRNTKNSYSFEIAGKRASLGATPEILAKVSTEDMGDCAERRRRQGWDKQLSVLWWKNPHSQIWRVEYYRIASIFGNRRVQDWSCLQRHERSNKEKKNYYNPRKGTMLQRLSR